MRWDLHLYVRASAPMSREDPRDFRGGGPRRGDTPTASGSPTIRPVHVADPQTFPLHHGGRRVDRVVAPLRHPARRSPSWCTSGSAPGPGVHGSPPPTCTTPRRRTGASIRSSRAPKRRAAAPRTCRPPVACPGQGHRLQLVTAGLLPFHRPYFDRCNSDASRWNGDECRSCAYDRAAASPR